MRTLLLILAAGLPLAWPQPNDTSLPQECQLYPNAPCLVPTQPRQETEQEREQREYQNRQLRIRCQDHKEDPQCH